MKFKKLIVILVVVLFLFSLVLVKKSMQNGEARKEAQRNELSGGVELIKEIPDIFLSRIVVYKGSDEKDKLVLAKDESGAWIVENKFRANARKEAISDLLNELKGLKGEVRGDSKELFPDFQIEDEKSVHLVLEGSADKALKHLVISFLLPAANKNFVREVDSPRVVLVDKNLLAKLNIFGKDDTPKALPFVDLKLPAFDVNGVTGIILESKGKDKIALKKTSAADGGNTVWSFDPAAAKEEIDQAKAERLLRSASNIYADDVMDPSQKTYGLEDPSFRITLTGSAGDKIAEIDVGTYLESEKMYYVKISSSDTVYKVPESYITGLKEGRSALLIPRAGSPK
jgi:hypothetical protein